MSISVGMRNIAETKVQGVTLRSVLGAYELIFGVYLTVYPEDDCPRGVSISGARISIKPSGGADRPLGFGRSDMPIEIQQSSHQSSMSLDIVMPMQARQLAAIEELRGSGDIDFELLVSGMGYDQNGRQPIQDRWRVHVPRSDWLKKLKAANARDVLLLEVPLSINKKSKKWSEITANLERAEEHFRNGDYHSCVSLCRTVVQEAGYQRYKKKEWSGPLLRRLAGDRKDMTKEDREASLWGALRHYTHQAHHGDSEGGSAYYSRSEAELILVLTASFVARA